MPRRALVRGGIAKSGGTAAPRLGQLAVQHSAPLHDLPALGGWKAAEMALRHAQLAPAQIVGNAAVIDSLLQVTTT